MPCIACLHVLMLKVNNILDTHKLVAMVTIELAISNFVSSKMITSKLSSNITSYSFLRFLSDQSTLQYDTNAYNFPKHSVIFCSIHIVINSIVH